MVPANETLKTTGWSFMTEDSLKFELEVHSANPMRTWPSGASSRRRLLIVPVQLVSPALSLRRVSDCALLSAFPNPFHGVLYPPNPSAAALFTRTHTPSEDASGQLHPL